MINYPLPLGTVSILSVPISYMAHNNLFLKYSLWFLILPLLNYSVDKYPPQPSSKCFVCINHKEQFCECIDMVNL